MQFNLFYRIYPTVQRAPRAGALHQSGNPVHVDRIYNVMYPGSDNPTYKDDKSRVNRISNVAISKYDTLIKVNGPLHAQLVDDRKFYEN